MSFDNLVNSILSENTILNKQQLVALLNSTSKDSNWQQGLNDIINSYTTGEINLYPDPIGMLDEGADALIEMIEYHLDNVKYNKNDLFEIFREQLEKYWTEEHQDNDEKGNKELYRSREKYVLYKAIYGESTKNPIPTNFIKSQVYQTLRDKGRIPKVDYFNHTGDDQFADSDGNVKYKYIDMIMQFNNDTPIGYKAELVYTIHANTIESAIQQLQHVTQNVNSTLEDVVSYDLAIDATHAPRRYCLLVGDTFPHFDDIVDILNSKATSNFIYGNSPYDLKKHVMKYKLEH